MTLAATPPVFDYVENGVTLLHAIPFQFDVSADIVCSRISAGIETVLILGVDYTVAGGAGGTGTVTKMSAGAVGAIFRIKRHTSRAQSTDYTPGDDFPAETHEHALDRLAAVNQEQDVAIGDLASRALQVPAGETIVSLPAAALRANQFLKFDENGMGFMVPGVPFDMADTIQIDAANTLFIRPSLNGPAGTLIRAATPDFNTLKPLEIAASTITIEPTDKIAINPTPSSFAQGFVVTQSSPLAGTVADEFSFNSFDITVRSARTPGGLPGNPGSGTWKGVRISMNAGGANYDGDSAMALAVGLVQTVADASTGDKNALATGVDIGAVTLGKAYGISSGATARANASLPVLFGAEFDLQNDSLNVGHVIGLNLWSGNSKKGIHTTAALTIGGSGGSGPAGLGFQGWMTAFRLWTQGGLTNDPMDPTGVLFDADKAMTIKDVFSFANLTVTGNILDFPHAELTGSGDLTIDGSFICTPGAAVAPTVNGQLAIRRTSNTSLTFILKGTDGATRSGAIALA